MTKDFLRRLEAWSDATAVVVNNAPHTFSEILSWRAKALLELNRCLPPGELLSFVPEFSPAHIGTFLAMMERGDIVVLCSSTRLILVDTVDRHVKIKGDALVIQDRAKVPSNSLVEELRRRKHPGLAFLSSGSTGRPKIVLHDFENMLGVFETGKKSRKTYAFLPFEQIGGFYNLLYSLSGGGTIVCDTEKTPDRVAQSIQDHQVELISCNPSFLRLFVMSGAAKRYNLSSLQQINFGTEPMPESTLALLHEAMPWVKLRQKFGMSEIGVIGAVVEGPVSPFIKLDANVCETRVRDGLLEVKSKTAMLGYLQGEGSNDQFTEDGWMRTGDLVEERGEFIHILGRKTDLINVGGRKVMPQEVEDALLEMPGIVDVLAEGEENAILGQVVKATIVTSLNLDPAVLRAEVRKFCLEKRLEAYKVPQRIVIKPLSEWNAQMKKQRRLAGKISES